MNSQEGSGLEKRIPYFKLSIHEPMNTKYLYWGSTGLVALLALASGTMYFVAEAPADSFARLGFPDYFRIQLGIAKLVGGMALLVPLPRWLKEWTYAGFTTDFGSAAIAHLAVGDPLSDVATPVVALVVLLTSYVSYHRYYLTDAEDEPVSA